MRIETIAVFDVWDLDHQNETLNGFSVDLLNAVDRIQFRGKELEKEVFSKKNWFEYLVRTCHNGKGA